MKNIQIPKSNSSKQENIIIEKNMVIVGANGSGKTRFGSKLASPVESRTTSPFV